MTLLALATLAGWAHATDGSPFRGLSSIPDLTRHTVRFARAAISLPLAAALGAAFAFRPRRHGTPPLSPAVVHTQVLLAVIGAMVMLVVGASLARAFGVVGAAGLVRYRAKIDDPKDAGVMLASLGVGLASGVGLYLLAVFATVFIMGVLVALESLSQDSYRLFDLTVTTKNPGVLRAGIEAFLQRNRIQHELRGCSEAEVSYQVRLPFDRTIDRLAEGLLRLDREASFKWDEKKSKTPVG